MVTVNFKSRQILLNYDVWLISHYNNNIMDTYVA